jgi:hypothetical protein
MDASSDDASADAGNACAYAERFRRRLRGKLAARCGLSGEEVERAVADLMTRDIGFRFDLDEIERP